MADSHFLWVESFQDKEKSRANLYMPIHQSDKLFLFHRDRDIWNVLSGKAFFLETPYSWNQEALLWGTPKPAVFSLHQRIHLSTENGLYSAQYKTWPVFYFSLSYFFIEIKAQSRSSLIWGLILWLKSRFNVSRTGLGLWQKDRMGHRRIKCTAFLWINWWGLSRAPITQSVSFLQCPL